MATINESIENNNKVFDVELNTDESQIALATANTYVDKNIIFNVNVDSIEDDFINSLSPIGGVGGEDGRITLSSIATPQEIVEYISSAVPDLTQEAF